MIIAGQDYRLYVLMEEDITGHQTVLIKYKKPDDTEGSFTATVETASTGLIYADVSDADNDQHGEWTFWGHVTFTDSTILIGCAVKQNIAEEGSC